MQPHDIVVSGLGVVSAAGGSADAFWDRCYRGVPAYSDVRILSGREGSQSVGRVTELVLDSIVPPRQARKLDRFTLMAIEAAHQALAAATVPAGDPRRTDVGLCVGNCTGGWSFVEPMMYGLYSQGPDAITPYVATAWFPAAPQGEISIHERLGGYSKTVSAGRASSGFAVQMSIDAVSVGHAAGMLAGGAEAPLTALVYGAFEESDAVAGGEIYRLFPDDGSPGGLMGEGAAFLYLETGAEATARRARPLATLAACTSGAGLAEVIREGLDRADLRPADLDCVIMNGRGTREHDEAEIAALCTVFHRSTCLALSAPRTLYGDTLGAGMAIDLATACLSLQHQAVLPTAALSSPTPLPIPGIHVVGTGRKHPIRTVLVYGCGEGEQAIAVVLRRPDQG